MSYDCSSLGHKNHDKTEVMADLGIIKLRSTLLSGGTCDSSGCVRGGWRVFLLLWWGISLGWEKSADSLRRNKD